MKRTAVAASMCLGMTPSAAFAVDWSIRTTQVETIELNDNQFLRQSPAGSIGSYSTLTANAQARTPTSKFDFDVDGNYKKFGGPGVEGAATEALTYGLKGRYQLNEKSGSDNEFVEANWRQSSAAFALLGELGVVTKTRGFIDSLTVRGGLDRTVTALDSLNLLASSTRISYDPSSGGTPLTDTTIHGSWRHRVNSIAALNVSSDFEMLDFDNALNTRTQIYRNRLGVDLTLSPVLSFRGNVGAINIITEDGANPLAATGASSSATASSALLDWIGDAVLTYRILKNTTLAITASQSIGPSIVGSLSKQDSITASLSHTLNSRSTLSFTAGVNRSIATTSTDYVSAAVTYGYSFTREWNAQLSYRYLHRFASTGSQTIDPITLTPTVSGTSPASSNSIMLVVSHNYIMLPSGN